VLKSRATIYDVGYLIDDVAVLAHDAVETLTELWSLGLSPSMCRHGGSTRWTRYCFSSAP
jgi:hypothetical protein